MHIHCRDSVMLVLIFPMGLLLAAAVQCCKRKLMGHENSQNV
jgi:hypothetical protein